MRGLQIKGYVATSKLVLSLVEGTRCLPGIIIWDLVLTFDTGLSNMLWSHTGCTIASYKNLFESLIRCLTENILEILVIFIIVFVVILSFSLLYSNLPEFVL